jgi:hypothetical protein
MMELVDTITDTLALIQLEIVEKIDRGGGLDGYYIVKVIDQEGTDSGWKGREIAVFDEYFYTNTEFIRKGFKIKGALKLMGGYSGERMQPGEKKFEKVVTDRTWEGFKVQGPIVHEAYLGPVVDVGIPVHCHFLLAGNLPVVEKWRKEKAQPDIAQLDIPKKGDWIKVQGGLYLYLLKELELTCSKCARSKKYMTTSLPTADELAGLVSVCRKCKHEQQAHAFPDICDKCKKRMWQWKGKSVEFPLDCECGCSRYDFVYDHMPLFIEGSDQA